MASYIPCNLDTTPMAIEIGNVSNNIQNTTNAVVAMNAAVIAAEAKSAKDISTNVNRGFFALINSQISQKIANKRSRVEALLMKLANQKRRLVSIRSSMEREYNRISSRYLRLFGNINKEMENRMKLIDLPVFELADKHVASTNNRMNNVAAIFNTSQSESIVDSQQILVSTLKNNAAKAMQEFKSFLTKSEKQKILLNQLLLDTDSNKPMADYCIPAIFVNFVNDKNGGEDVDVFLPAKMNHLKSQVERLIQYDDMKKDNKHIPDEVIREYKKIVEMDSMDSKVKEMMLFMLEKNNSQEI